MRLEWQGTRELDGRRVTNTISVEIAGESDADAMRIRRYLKEVKETLVDPDVFRPEGTGKAG